MDGVLSAIAWSGADVTLSMFVLSPSDQTPPLDTAGLEGLRQLRTYELRDELEASRGLHVYEYDLIFKDVPPRLDELLREALVRAITAGATAAWFGFEGSFDFRYILHPEIASQVYGVAAGEALKLALSDEDRLSGEWTDFLVHIRDVVLGS